MVNRVKKRDGRIVLFNREKIANAIFSAAKSVGGKDKKRSEELAGIVEELINKKFGEDYIPTVEEIQDIVEKVLIENGHAKTAKSYILYRKEKERVRNEKKVILNKKSLDEVDKRFSTNALRVLASRYLIRNDKREIIESPKELFMRVALNIGLPEILFDERVFDKNGNIKISLNDLENYKKNYDKWDKVLKIGKYALTRYHFERFLNAFEELAKEGNMKIQFSKFVNMILNGEFNEYEKIIDEYYNLMTNQDFMPNTPALVNSGRKLGMLSACFTLDVDDDMESILKLAHDVAMVQKAGGGTGMNFSKLRPRDDIIKSTMGKSSGPVSFMKLINTITEVVKQGGVRRGANMGIMEVWHPDIEEFVTCKQKEGEYENFNISVGLWKEFWEALKEGKEFPLINPRNNEIVKYVDPKTIFDLIAYNAWKSADPGVLFFDVINKYNVLKGARDNQPIRVTNPCVTADTMVLTNRGLINANEIKEGDRVWTIEGWKNVEKFYNRGIKKINRIILSNGLELKATPEHKLLTKDGWREIKNLKEGDEVRLIIESPEEINADFNSKFNGGLKEAEFLGFFCGDGSISNSNHVTLHIKEGSELINYFKNIMRGLFGNTTETKDNGMIRLDIHRNEIVKKMREYFDLEKESSSESKIVPKEILNSNFEIQRAFLRGLFSADGSVYNANGTIAISLSSTSLELLKQVQIMLLADGIFSTLTNEKDREVKKIKGKEYSTKGTYRILINGKGTKLFNKKIGFIGEKDRKLKKLISNKSNYKKEHLFVKIKKIEDVGEEEVYDIEAPDTFTWTTNGIYSYDCGEEPLYPYESCNLASINVANFVKEENGKLIFDWDRFRKVTRRVARALDNMITMNKYPLDIIDKRTKEMRRVGVGVMGLADALFMLKLRYNSKEGYDFMEKIMENLTYYSYVESIELSKKRGTFPVYDKTEYKNGKLPIAGFYDKSSWSLEWDKLIEDIKKFGLRNAMVTTCPPTGSVSMIADTTNGIEPVFALVYEKRVTVGNFFYVDEIFEKELRKRGLYSDEILKKIADNYGSLQNINEIPEEIKRIFVTTMDIHWLDHIYAQGIMQKWVTDSISKTINLPKYASVDDIKQAYIFAYLLGCKGVTIYRDESKSIQVLNVTSEKKEKLKTEPSEYVLNIAKGALKNNNLKNFVTILKEDKPKLKISIPVENSLPNDPPKNSQKLDKCPICGGRLVYEAGCVRCVECGWSECVVS